MDSVYRIHPPAYRRNLILNDLAETGNGRYSDGLIEARVEVGPYANGSMDRIHVTWTNITDQAMRIQPVMEAETGFVPDHYVIPCVLYNGNAWGEGKEPKGLKQDGVSRTFSYERTGIPSCTLSENREHAFAWFASPRQEEMTASSCSLIRKEDGTMIHRILFPVIEEPYTYCGRDAYSGPKEDTILLSPGASFDAVLYAWQSRPMWPDYGMAGLEDAFLEAFPVRTAFCRTEDDVWDLGIRYAKTLSMPYDGHHLFVIGLEPNEAPSKELHEKKSEAPHTTADEAQNAGDFSAKRIHFEFGWCGQNGMYARMLIHDYLRAGSRESLEMALSCLDAFAERAVSPNGLMYVHYESRFQEGRAVADTCNLGYGMAEFSRCFRLLKTIGIEKPAYLKAARGIGDFLIAHWSEESGFGKAWDVRTGEQIDGSGTIGAFAVCGLVELYRTTGEKSYLEAAEKALLYYDRRDLARFYCTAGALDTRCIDKETSGALIIGGILLYEETGRDIYLDIARRGAYYFSSWMYHYDVPYAETSDFAVYGYRTLGGTSVSAQHHHIDPWGGLMVPWFVKLSRYLDDPRWQVRADMLWSNVIQMIADDETGEVHGMKRPAGAQNEAFLHCRWGWVNRGVQNGDPVPGRMNDWLVAWPGAFRLYAIIETLKER